MDARPTVSCGRASPCHPRGLAMCAVVVYFLWSGRHDRDKEEEAREYFDAHGHWPDEA